MSFSISCFCWSSCLSTILSTSLCQSFVLAMVLTRLGNVQKDCARFIFYYIWKEFLSKYYEIGCKNLVDWNSVAMQSINQCTLPCLDLVTMTKIKIIVTSFLTWPQVLAINLKLLIHLSIEISESSICDIWINRPKFTDKTIKLLIN